MSGDIVKLRLARKARARRMAEDAAAANRATFGRNKADLAAVEADAQRIARTLDGARRQTDRPKAGA